MINSFLNAYPVLVSIYQAGYYMIPGIGWKQAIEARLADYILS